jgi:RNA polymerase sigma factor (TIGR02999 family)
MNNCRQFQLSNPHSGQAVQNAVLAEDATGNQTLTKILDTVPYERLCKLASGILRREAPEHGWDAADLVHEAFLRMARSRIPLHFQSTNHLIALTAIIMRHILIDRARSTTISDRYRRVSLDLDLPFNADANCEEIALRDALKRLGKLESRMYQVVEMRFFRELAVEEIASNLSISARTVKRDWKAALNWLRQELNNDALHAERQDRNDRRATVMPRFFQLDSAPVPRQRRSGVVA